MLYTGKRKSHLAVRMLCEGGIMLAAAFVLSLLQFWKMYDGGGIDFGMLPILLFAVRWGVGPGLVGGICAGSVIGCVSRFLVHYIVGATIWAEYMPDLFFGLTMTSPWFYSLLYNGFYMAIDMVLCLVVFGLLSGPLGKYFRAEDIRPIKTRIG